MAKRDRFFAGFGAALFLITSSALTIAVVVSLTQKNSNNNVTNTANASSKTNQSSSIASLDFQDGTVLPGYQPQTQPLGSIEIADIDKGSGTTVKPGASVTVDYVGFLADSGKVFDSSASHGGPASLSLNQVIQGWAKGIPGMKVGGTRELLIPAALGYGSQAVTGIPSNSDLGFYVRVDSVKNP